MSLFGPDLDEDDVLRIVGDALKKGGQTTGDEWNYYLGLGEIINWNSKSKQKDDQLYENFQILLDYLGLEVVEGKRIVQKRKKVGRPRKI